MKFASCKQEEGFQQKTNRHSSRDCSTEAREREQVQFPRTFREPTKEEPGSIITWGHAAWASLALGPLCSQRPGLLSPPQNPPSVPWGNVFPFKAALGLPLSLPSGSGWSGAEGGAERAPQWALCCFHASQHLGQCQHRVYCQWAFIKQANAPPECRSKRARFLETRRRAALGCVQGEGKARPLVPHSSSTIRAAPRQKG